jgi:hypothetical protein
VQSRVQRRETTSVTDCDSVARRNTADGASADRHAFADTRRNADRIAVPNTDGADADAITPVILKAKEPKRAVSRTLAALFRFRNSTSQMVVTL